MTFNGSIDPFTHERDWLRKSRMRPRPEVIVKRTGMNVFREALDKFALNRDEDVTVYSDVSQKCTIANCYVGIDEAGRGPVLGPMVYSIFACMESAKVIIKELEKGVSIHKIEENPPVLLDSIEKLNDSKQLTEKTRDEIFAQFSDLDYIVFGIKIISPTQISSKSYRRQKVSLNDVSHEAAMELIQGLRDRGVNVGKVYVDTVGPMDKYQKKLELKFPELKFKVDKKADSKYKVVSAASICAKVTRDQALKEWKFSKGAKVHISSAGWGSGYPGDETTKRFLRSNIDQTFGFPNIVRDSWSTASDLLEKRAVKVKWEADENDTPVSKISKFFVRKKTTGTEKGDDDGFPLTYVKPRAQFFAYRDLVQTPSLF